MKEVESLPLNYQVAGLSTVLALIGIVVAWYLYGRNPLKTGQVDPLKKPLRGVFTGMENKWYVDELYNAIIITPYRKISYFLADVIDWRFWHDWFHEKVIAGSYNWFSNVLLNEYVDQRGIDRARERPGPGHQIIIGGRSPDPERIRAFVCAVRAAGCCHYSRIFDFAIISRSLEHQEDRT